MQYLTLKNVLANAVHPGLIFGLLGSVVNSFCILIYRRRIQIDRAELSLCTRQRRLYFIEALKRLIKGTLFVRVSVDHQGQRAAQVIKNQHLFGEHQQNIGNAQLVRRARAH